MANAVNTELWKQYNGKGFAAEYAEYSERANKDVDGNEITTTYATKADVATTYATKESVEAKQDTLTFGYNSNSQIISIDNHDLAPSTDSTVYLAQYNSTRGDAVNAALQAGKAVMCRSYHEGDTVNPKFGVLGTYDRGTNQYQYTFIRKTTHSYEQATGDIAFTSVFNNSSGNSWFGQFYNLTFKAPTAEGQVMKSVNVNNSHFDWALSTVKEVPASTTTDSGKMLGVDSSGNAGWLTFEDLGLMKARTNLVAGPRVTYLDINISPSAGIFAYQTNNGKQYTYYGVPYTPSTTTDGQVLMYSSNNGPYWGTVPGLPSSAVEDAGKILTVNAQGNPAWTAFERDTFGSLTDDEGDEIQDEEGNSIGDENSVELWTSFNGIGFGAERAVADADGNNIAETYAKKGEASSVTTSYDALTKTLTINI